MEIDEIASLKLDPIKLPAALESVKKRLAGMPLDTREGYYDYMKEKLGVKADFIKAIRQEVKSISKEGTEEETVSLVITALFPELIDLVTADRSVAFLK